MSSIAGYNLLLEYDFVLTHSRMHKAEISLPANLLRKWRGDFLIYLEGGSLSSRVFYLFIFL